MLKNKTKFVAIFLALFVIFSTTYVFADLEEDLEESTYTEEVTDESVLDEEESYDESTSEITENDVYLFGDDITVDYLIDGNLYVMGNNVTISSQINGDAFICAKTLTVAENGYVYNNLFAAAETINIKGVSYDIYAVAKEFNLDGGYIYRDALLAGTTINMNGIIGRNAKITCSTLNFNVSDENASTMIYGDLTYNSNSQATIPEGVVSGEVKYSQFSTSEEVSVRAIIADYVFDALKFAVLVLAVWLVCLWLAPKFLAKTNDLVGKSTLKVLGLGLLTFVVVPIAVILLLVLRITAQPALLLTISYVLAFIVAKPLFLIVVNNFICSKLKIEKKLATCGTLAATSIIFYVLVNLPFVGIIFTIVSVLFGLGIFATSIIPEKKKLND